MPDSRTPSPSTEPSDNWMLCRRTFPELRFDSRLFFPKVSSPCCWSFSPFAFHKGLFSRINTISTDDCAFSNKTGSPLSPKPSNCPVRHNELDSESPSLFRPGSELPQNLGIFRNISGILLPTVDLKFRVKIHLKTASCSERFSCSLPSKPGGDARPQRSVHLHSIYR